jgi:hypothetical protein
MSVVKPAPPFEELVRLSGRLRALWRTVQGVRRRARGPRFCRRITWREFRPRLVRIVGWGAPPGTPAVLQTVAAFDRAERALYKLLPDCGPECPCQCREQRPC